MPPLGAGTILAANRRMLRTEHKARINGQKTSQKCKFIQINLQHIKTELALLCQTVAVRELHIAVIQEPSVYQARIRGLQNTSRTLCSAEPNIAPRSCTIVRNMVRALPPSELCSWDVAMAGNLLCQHISPVIQTNRLVKRVKGSR